MDKKKRKPFDRFSPDNEDWFRTPFSLLEGMLEGIEKQMQKNLEELQRSTVKPKKGEYGNGMFLRIFSDGEHPPKIEVSRLGPRGWEPVREKAFGRVPIKKPIELPATSYPAPRAKPVTEVKPLITYEEAPYTYSIDINKVTIELKISGVEKEENINLQFYPESLEIKAIAPKMKKGYFAVLKIPAQIDQENTEVKIEKDKVVISIPRRYAITRESSDDTPSAEGG